MKSKFFLFFLLAVATVITSCSDSQNSADSVLRSIPNDVSMVTSIDADGILEKADFENVKQMAFYQEMISNTERYNSTLAAVLTDPWKSGVDLSKNIYVAHHLNPDDPEEVFVGIVASVKDKATLESLINSGGELKISKQGNFDVAMKGSQSVAWNAEKVVLGMTNSYNDQIGNLEKFFNTEADQSISNDSNLKKAMSGNHDITSWMSSNALANSGTLKNALIAASISPDAAKDNFIHGYVDFNDGAIESNSDLYLQSALMEDINLLFKDKVNTDFSSYIPADANSVMTVSLDLEGVQSVLQKKGVLMMANFGLKEYGLTVEDIASTFGGDILLYSTPGKTKTPYGTFATDISNKENLGKFLTLATDYNILTKVSDSEYTINNTSMVSGNGFSGQDVQLLITDKMLFVSANPAIIEKIAAGGYSGSEKIDKARIKALKGNILAGFMDFTQVINATGAKDLDLNFENLNFTTNRKNSNFNLKFKDKNSNGLKQLFESINELYLANQKGEI